MTTFTIESVLLASRQAEKVLKALEERDLTVAWAARQIGESRQVVWNWLNGYKNPTDPNVYDRLLAAIEGQTARVSEARAVYGAPAATVKVPVYTVGSAGEWPQAEATEEVELPVQFFYPDYRPVLIDGFSMAPHILPGDIAVFREWKVPKVGFVNACSRDGNLYVKLVDLLDGQISLVSFNPEAAPIDPDQVQALGYLVGLFRDDGTESFYRHNRGGLRF